MPLSVCHTYCTHTYVLAAKNNQCTGMKKKHSMSEVSAMHTKKIEKAKPWYLNESYTERRSR